MQDNSSQNLQNLLEGNYNLNTGDYIGRGWEKFQEKPVLFILFTIVVFLVGGINSQWQQFLDPTIARPLNLAVTLVSIPLGAGFIIGSLKILQNQSLEFGDFFKGFNYYSQLVLAGIIGGILIILGSILCLIPGIYLSIGYSFTNYLIIDRNFGFWEAMENSRIIVSKQWFSWFGFFFILGLINIVGALLCGVGLLATIPVTVLATAAAYEDVMGIHKREY